jgi:hypothetical protein
MAYTHIQDIKQGMDRSRASRVISPLGSAWTIKNAHLTRGGDIERMKKFVKQGNNFPSTTKGLFAINDTLYTIGYDATEAGNVPSGVTHILNQNPNTPSNPISKVLDGESFDGKLYSIVQFDDGNIYHYYDTARVTAWDTLASSVGSNDAVAAALESAIDNSTEVNASVAGSVVTITSAEAGTPFTISASTVNNGVSPQTEVLASASFTIDGGSSDPGVNKIDSITVNGVDILGSAVDWTTSNNATASAIQSQITSYTSSPEYTATVDGSEVTITALAGTGSDPNGYEVIVNKSGDVTLTYDNGESGGEDEQLATGTIEVTGGTRNVGVNQVTSVEINGVEVMGSAINWGTSDAVTTNNIALTMNGYTSSPEYDAVSSGICTITAKPGTGATPNGYVIDVTTSGDVTVTTSGTMSGGADTISAGSTTLSGGVDQVDNETLTVVETQANVVGVTEELASVDIEVTGGTNSPGVNYISSITIDGVEILNANVDWVTSNSTTATAIKTQLDTYTSSPEYDVTTDGPIVTITAKAGTGASTNGFVVTTSVAGDVTLDAGSTMTGGVTAVTAVAQINTVTVGGTFEEQDQFTVTINGQNYTVTGSGSGTGTTALTFKKKIYSTASSNLYFSALNAPTQWISGIDYGFINMGSENSGQETLTATAEYQGLMAIFSENNIRVWSISEDSAANVALQTLQNTGTVAPQSVLSYGNNDVFYLAATGVRSLKARDSSNSAYVSDVGTSIDTHIREYLATLTDAEIAEATATIEPLDGRYWLAVGKRIYVFSFFPSKKISSWSYYDLNFRITHFAKIGDRIYARGVADDNTEALYLYGGTNNDTYPELDEQIATIELPFLSQSGPATFKDLIGFDIIATNVWTVKILPDPSRLTTEVEHGKTTGITYGKPRFGLTGVGSMFGITLTCNLAGKATISALALHYNNKFEDG